MADFTPKLGLPLMASNAAQREVLYNEAILAFDALVGRIALSVADTPPMTPALGDVHIVAHSATTGAFVGHEDDIAFYYNGWQFFSAVNKMKFYVVGSSNYFTFNGTSWASDATPVVAVLDDLTDVNATAPSDNDVLIWDAGSGLWVAGAIPATSTFAALTDVDNTTFDDGDFLQYNQSAGKWEGVVVTIPTVIDQLQNLSDVTWGTPGNGQVLTYNSGTSKAVWGDAPTQVIPALSDLTDVNVSGAIENDALVWNGAVWAPSSVAFNYSFEQMVDGPGTFTGFAAQFLVVNSTETALEFQSLGALLSSSGILVQDLGDVDAHTVADFNKVLQLYDAGGGNHKFRYATLPVATPIYDGVTLEVSAPTKLTFNGFNVDHTGTEVSVAPIPLTWEENGVALSGPAITGVNVTGTGVGFTNVGGVATFTIASGVTDLGALTDVDLTTPADNAALFYDSGANKWIDALITLAGKLSDVNITTPSNNQLLTYDNATSKWLNKPSASDIGVFFPGIITNSNQLLMRYKTPRAFTIPADMTGSVGVMGTAPPSSPTTLDVKKNGSSIATVTIAASTGNFSFTTVGSVAVDFSVGDVLEVLGPSSPDGTAADYSLTILANKT